MRSVSETINNAFEAMESFGYVFANDARSKVTSAAMMAKTRGDVAKVISMILPSITLSSPDYGRKA